MMPALAGLDPVAPALAGHGGPQPRQTFDEALDDLEAQLAESPIDLVGYSFGARLGLGLIIRFPTLIRRATLVGVNPGLEDDERQPRFARDEQWAKLIETDFAAFLEAWSKQPIFSSQSQEVREAKKEIRAAHDPSLLAAAMRQSSLGRMPNYWPKLSGISVPIQLITGALDTKFTDMARRIVEQTGCATHHAVPGVGHDVPAEASEVLSQLITSFHG